MENIKEKCVGKFNEKPLILSQVTDNNFSIKGNFSGIPYQISYKDFIMGATEEVVEDNNGDLYIKLVESSEGKDMNTFLKKEKYKIFTIFFSLTKKLMGL